MSRIQDVSLFLSSTRVEIPKALEEFIALTNIKVFEWETYEEVKNLRKFPAILAIHSRVKTNVLLYSETQNREEPTRALKLEI